MKKLFFLLPILFLISFVLTSEENNFSQENQLLDESVEIFHNPKDIELTSEIIKILSEQHYVKKPYGSIRSEVFNLFIERLDPAKNIFLESEILPYQAELSPLKNNIESDLVAVFKLFEIYKNRYLSRHIAQVKFLNELTEQDLLLDKRIKRDRGEADRHSKLNELKTLWKDLIVNDVIQLLLSGNTLEEAKEKLSKRLAIKRTFLRKLDMKIFLISMLIL